MKVVYDDRVYVQKKDLVYLLICVIDKKLVLPESIFRRIYSSTFLENSYGQNDFIKFTRREECAYFDKIDFILDYNEFKDMNLFRLGECANKIKKERDYLIERTKMPSIKSSWEFNLIGRRCEFLDYKLHCMNDIINYRRGFCDYSIPSDEKSKEEKIKIFRIKYHKDKS